MCLVILYAISTLACSLIFLYFGLQLVLYCISLFFNVMRDKFGIYLIPESWTDGLGLNFLSIIKMYCWNLTKFFVYYGAFSIFYISLICFIIGTVNETVKIIFNFISKIKQIQNENQVQPRKKDALLVIAILLGALLLLIFSSYLSFYFDSYIWKFPLIFYTSYTLACGLSFPTNGYNPNLGRIDSYFASKITINMVVVLGCFAFREVYYNYELFIDNNIS